MTKQDYSSILRVDDGMGGQYIIKDASVVRVKSGLDLSSMDLTVQEGFLVSRITGEVAVKELYHLSMSDRKATAHMIRRLIERGVLEVTNEQVTDGKHTPQYAGHVFNPADLQEEADLSLEEKKEIIFYHDRVGRRDFYKLLGVSSYTAERPEIKKAFLRLSKKFHPDTHFGKQLGSFRTKMKEVYNEMAEANRVLSHEESRMEYLRKLLDEHKIKKEDVEGLDLESPEERQAKNEEAERMARLRMNPMVQRVLKAKEHYKLAMEDIKKEDWLSAANNLNMAKTFDPYNEEYNQALDSIVQKSNALRAQKFFDMAQSYENYGKEGYLDMYRKAADLAPMNAEFNLRIGAHYMDFREPEKAKRFLTRAVKANPKHKEARVLLARCLMSTGEKKEAIPHLQAVVDLDPKHKAATELLRKAKSWFG